MPHVDEGLLSKLVDKFGVDNASKGPNRNKLWAKVTKDYNAITGNMHTKARLDKKWQNIKHTRKMKQNDLMKSDDATTTGGGGIVPESLNISTSGSYQELGENVWNVMDYALRDLFLHLVKKYNIENTSNPRQKNEYWKNFSKEFHDILENVVIIKHEKFTKKWQNWKQYNKVKQKPHPFDDDKIVTDYDVIREKIRKFKERSRMDSNFAAFLSRESDEPKTIEGMEGWKATKIFEVNDPTISNTSTVSSAMSNKQLEREVFLEALKCEQERYKTLVENSRLEQEKLKRENDYMDLQVQLAQADLAIKKQALHEKGLSFQ